MGCDSIHTTLPRVRELERSILEVFRELGQVNHTFKIKVGVDFSHVHVGHFFVS